jgi:antitoxin MazE
MRAQMVKWGNSLAVRIPKSVAQEANLKAGDPLAEGAVQLHRVGRVPALARLVSMITPDNRYEEIFAGPGVGKENVEW